MNVFDEMGDYWAEIADQNNTERQINFIKNILEPPGLILDLACGTGRHLIPLSKQGFSLIGLDLSPELLRIAKSQWNQAQVVLADMRFLPFKHEVFAAVISMDTSFGYLPSELDDLLSLKDVKYSLKKGGVLVVDVFNRQHLTKKYNGQSQSKEKEYPSFFLLQNRSVTANGGKLCDKWTVREKSDGQIRVFQHIARLYKRSQLQELLENAGFILNKVCGNYGNQEFHSDSSRLIIVALAK
jgi:SAM-dependent methyltransferase